MAKKLTNKALIKKLEVMNHEQLVNLILELFQTNEVVEKKLNVFFLEDEYASEQLEKYKKKLEKTFNSLNRFSLDKAKMILSEFSDICHGTKWQGELALYFAYLATEFTMTYGDMNEKFYDALCEAYQEAVTMACEEEELFRQWKEQLEYVYYELSDAGWGVGEVVAEEYFSIPWVEND